MNWLQFGNYKDIYIACGHAILEMQLHRFANILIEFVDGLPLGENVFPDSARTPEFSVVIYFNFY